MSDDPLNVGSPLVANRQGWPWDTPPASLPPTLPDGTPWPKITLVTPSYNQAASLETTIRSVLLQGYPNLEYIVMDGGSTDGSVAVLEHYAPWLTAWVSEPDGGQSDAINKGFARAQGTIFGWINSDDLLLPDALATVASIFHESPGLGLFYGNVEIIDVEGHYLRVYEDFRPYEFEKLLHDEDIVPQPAAFFSAEAWRTVGPLDVNLHYVMDWDLWIKIARQFPVHSRQVNLAQFRVYPSAKSHSGGLKRLMEMRTMLLSHGSHAARAYYKIGLWYYKRNQMADARRYFKEGLQRHPSPEVRRYLIRLWLKSLFGNRVIGAGRWLRRKFDLLRPSH